MQGWKLALGLGVGALWATTGASGCGGERQYGRSVSYKCDKCGKTSSSPGSCCGAPMTKQETEGSRRREGS